MTFYVACDFDDTAAEMNVAQMLLERFAARTTRMHRELFSRGETDFREYQERAFDEVRATVGEMSEYVSRNASLRPGFAELVEAASGTGGSVKIVSAGLRFYIRALLDARGFEKLDIVAVDATASSTGRGPFRYDYPLRLRGCDPAGAVCKCKAIMDAKAAGMRTVFIGDGLRSDACAAARAEVVFARSRLLNYCRENGIPANPFESLHPAASFLRAQSGKPEGRAE